MSTTKPRMPASALPEVLKVTPITAAKSASKRGRPKKITIPDMPNWPMEEDEKQLYTFFIESHRQEYAPITPTDEIHLILAAVEYILTLRTIKWELETKQQITMARQHPLNQMRAELDSLSFTRKARTQGKSQESPELARAREQLRALSS